MRLGLNLGYWGAGGSDGVELAQEAERLGFDSVWTAEAYGSDALTPLTWVGALTSKIKLGTGILQMPARTPANTAMSAATLDMLSGGRVLLGLGLSGPQVVEGWHGQPYGKPLTRTREYVEIVRADPGARGSRWTSTARTTRSLSRPGATGLGKPLKLILHPRRADIPIYLAAIGPKNVELAAEIADGWLPDLLRADKARPTADRSTPASRRPAAVRRSPTSTSPRPSRSCSATTSTRCRAFVKPMLALYIGGMGAAGTQLLQRPRLPLRLRRPRPRTSRTSTSTARSARPTPRSPTRWSTRSRSSARRSASPNVLEPWKRSRVTTLICGTTQPEAMRVMAELCL